MVVEELILRNIRAEDTDMMVECFSGIKTEQLQIVIEKRHIGSLETVIVHMGTKALRTTRDLVFVWGEAYALMAKAKKGNCEMQNCPEWSVST